MEALEYASADPSQAERRGVEGSMSLGIQWRTMDRLRSGRRFDVEDVFAHPSQNLGVAAANAQHPVELGSAFHVGEEGEDGKREARSQVRSQRPKGKSQNGGTEM
jgi:hypothetical protein